MARLLSLVVAALALCVTSPVGALVNPQDKEMRYVAEAYISGFFCTSEQDVRRFYERHRFHPLNIPSYLVESIMVDLIRRKEEISCFFVQGNVMEERYGIYLAPDGKVFSYLMGTFENGARWLTLAL